MDDELFNALYRNIINLSPDRTPNMQHADRLIVLIYFWSVLRNKPMFWACQRRNLPKLLREYPTLPSPATLSRRLKSASITQLIDRIEQSRRPADRTPRVGCWMIDAKPFPISPYSKDAEARRGWAYDRLARGYKLFCICDDQQRVIDWQVHAMNAAECTVARDLVPAIDQPGYLLGDSVYDTNDPHALCADQQLQLLAPRKDSTGRIGPRARHPNRLHAIDMLETFVNHFGPLLYRQRTMIERLFARLGSHRVGLSWLPPWVRTLRRVRRYVQAKMILYQTLQHTQ